MSVCPTLTQTNVPNYSIVLNGGTTVRSLSQYASVTTSDSLCVIAGWQLFDVNANGNYAGSWLSQSSGNIAVAHASRGTGQYKMKFTYKSVNYESNAFTVTVDCPALSVNNMANVGGPYSFTVPATAAGSNT